MVAHGTLDELRRSPNCPTRIRCKVADARGRQRCQLDCRRRRAWRRVNGHMVEIDAAPGATRSRLLRRATRRVPRSTDIDIVPPTLDDLYAHFLRGGGGA